MNEQPEFLDTHVHFFDHTQPDLTWSWLEPGIAHPILGDIEGMKGQRFTALGFEAESRFNHVRRCVHIQAALGTEDPVAETAWTGSEMIVVGAQQDDHNVATTDHAVGLAYDPSTDTWRTLPESPLSPQASTITWTGEYLVAVDYLETTALYDPPSDQWKRLDDFPSRTGDCDPRSALVRAVVFVLFCEQTALLDLETHTWTAVGIPDSSVFGRAVSTGDVVLIPGAGHGGGNNAMWQFDPAADPADGEANVVDVDAAEVVVLAAAATHDGSLSGLVVGESEGLRQVWAMGDIAGILMNDGRSL
jgi:hypothetical protein